MRGTRPGGFGAAAWPSFAGRGDYLEACGKPRRRSSLSVNRRRYSTTNSAIAPIFLVTDRAQRVSSIRHLLLALR